MIIDFAGVADFELEAGAPITWASWEEFRFVRSTAEAAELHWSSAEVVAVRWGDPRIDSILELWQEKLSRDDSWVGHHVLHGRHIAIVSAWQVGQWHIIPKALGTHDVPIGEDPVKISDDFNPRLYHRGQPVQVLGWSMPDEMARLSFQAALEHRVPIYIEWQRHFAMFHMACPVIRTGRPADEKIIHLS